MTVAASARHPGDVRRRLADEAGHSLISSIFGVLMFLVLLLFTVQVTTHLHATTVVATAAFDAARLVSGSPSIATDGAGGATCRLPTPDELGRADAHLRQLLGGLWDDAARADWSATTVDEVAVTVAVQTPARVVGGVGVVVGLDRIERTVSLARECTR